MNKKKYMHFLVLIVCCCVANLIVSQTFWITSNADSGPGTVRQAITDLNNSADATNEIKVALAGNTTVALESELPVISKQVTFDGQDQLSPSPLLLTANVPLAHVIIIVSDSSTVKNITINDIGLFNRAALLVNANMCTVEQCNIENIQGITSAGTTASSGTVIGIHVISGSTTTLSNCVIDTFSNDSELTIMYGIEITNSSQSTTITNCTIRNLHGSSSGTGPQASTIVAGIHSDTSITNLTIMNTTIEMITNDIDNGQSYGIFHEGGAGSGETTITDCTIHTIRSGVKTTIITDDACAVGIRSTDTAGLVSNNTIEHVSSADSPTNTESGNTHGILLNNNTECNSNTVSYISSGGASKASDSIGIAITNPADCSFNTVSNVTSGDALVSQAIGIFLSTLVDANCDGNVINTIIGTTVAIGLGIFSAQKLEIGSTLSGNTIDTIQSESTSFGILIVFCKEMSLVLNTIQNVEASPGTAYGIALGGDDGGTELFVTDTAIVENAIRHIHGTTEGIGIILLDNALHNIMLSNIICDVTTKGIGVPNSPVDAVCVLLRAFLLPHGDVRVRGLLSNVAFINEEYLLQFFVNQCNTVPEAPRLIQELFFTSTAETTPFDITFTPTFAVEKDQYITMTATFAGEALTQASQNSNNNTSELSNTRRVRTDADSLCTFICNTGTDNGSCCFISR